MNIKELTYDLINRAKGDGGSAIVQCEDQETAELVRERVKEAIKFYSNLDVTIVRDTEVNVYSWTANELAKDVDLSIIDINERDHNVGGNTRSPRNRRRINTRSAEPDSGRDPEFGF